MEKGHGLAEKFLYGKEGKRGDPDGVQVILTRSGREIFRQGVCVLRWYSF
ncbi:hypothetical protein ANACOL_03867 [Anaerotruncus colihominis DSM 17241]|uniref:Uncharacterized protein n=1 Tax=Anaerotruncus colihominis DSM 17241 TaxID=445972 RepID=B0PGD4_9FIRM|nr:hypothetical protein ANACOL_03867 [Anaerotruncus colihominis DSM 17241]